MSKTKTKTKNKPHKGLLKRVRVTKSGKIKFQRACGRHLRSHKSASATRSYRLPAFAHAADSPRLRGMLCLPSKGKRSRPATPAGTSKQTEDKDS
ncbi:MAG: 50S ribosomal protein L35 [Planctomycetes bacterium]|nr:50S ribosomal protein L35 [Planctomycetota bacterium]